VTVRPAAAPSAWPWRLVSGALALLLAAALGACVLALALTRSVTEVAERTLLEDVEVEDEAEDVAVAVLALKGEHAQLTITGPTRVGAEEHALALDELRTEIGELADLGIALDGVATPGELRAATDRYAALVAPVIDDASVPAPAFDEVMDAGLARLADLEVVSLAVDAAGSERGALALRQLRDQTTTASIVLVAVLLAVVLAGLTVAVLGFRVLSELRRLATAERRSSDHVAALLQSRTEFIADASHELRTPLTILRGNADLGARLAPADCVHVQVLHDISVEASRMGRLVDELLFLARHDAGASPIDLEDVELEVLAADVAARSEALGRQRGARLVVSIDATGPARVDPGRLEQATLVLVDNAVAYGPPSGPVDLAVQARDGFVTIEVGDRGPGIPADVLPHVFERFRRGAGSGRRREGAGLGLAIARAIAEGHGGTLEAVTREGGGMLMRLRIPTARRESVAAQAAIERGATPSRTAG
jgi:signal transduction histidine kinase